jgi:DNA modification methylase
MEMSDWRVEGGDCLEVLRGLAEGSVQCVVTSPPYWGLRDYGVPGQLGLEGTPEEYVAKLVEVFREVRRVLRDDGTVWLNLGDSYCTKPNGPNMAASTLQGSLAPHSQSRIAHGQRSPGVPSGLKHKDLVMIPARVALALQNDGWYLRSDIVWAKPNPMPESCTDRPTSAWEHVFLLAKSGTATFWTHRDGGGTREQPAPDYRWRDGLAGGAETAEEPAGWRDERLADGKTKRWSRANLWAGRDYFYDADAVREPMLAASVKRFDYAFRGTDERNEGMVEAHHGGGYMRSDEPHPPHPGGRNLRNVWTIATQAFPEAHFATFPEKLVEPCVRAGSSAKSCAECGAAWVRVVEKTTAGASGSYAGDDANPGKDKTRPGHFYDGQCSTLGFLPGCTCSSEATTGSLVLDPFCGSGTVGVVCVREGRRFVGIELNPEYVGMAERRITEAAAQPRLFAAADTAPQPVQMTMGDELVDG